MDEHRACLFVLGHPEFELIQAAVPATMIPHLYLYQHINVHQNSKYSSVQALRRRLNVQTVFG